MGEGELWEEVVSQEDLEVSARPREAKTGELGMMLVSLGRHRGLLEIQWLSGNECPGLVWIGPQAPPVLRLMTGGMDATILLAISTRSH